MIRQFRGIGNFQIQDMACGERESNKTTRYLPYPTSRCVFVLRHLPGGGTTAVSHVIQRSQGDRTEEDFCVGRLRVPREVSKGIVGRFRA